MAYFGKSWQKFFFLVEPEILCDVFAVVRPVLVNTNGRVPADYEFTPQVEYIKAYARMA